MCFKQEHQEHKSRNYLLKKKKKPKNKTLESGKISSLCVCEICIFNCLAIFLVERKEEEKNLKEHERRKEGKRGKGI